MSGAGGSRQDGKMKKTQDLKTELWVICSEKCDFVLENVVFLFVFFRKKKISLTAVTLLATCKFLREINKVSI